MYSQNNKIILHVMRAVNHKYCLTLFLLLDSFRYFTYEQLCCLIKYQACTCLLLSSFTFAPPFSFTPFAASVLFFFFSHLLLFLSFFLFYFHLFTLILLWVLLYFFMGLFVFESVGFVWAYAEEGETAAGFLFMGCVSWVFKGWDRWVWVVSSGRRRSGSGSAAVLGKFLKFVRIFLWDFSFFTW